MFTIKNAFYYIANFFRNLSSFIMKYIYLVLSKYILHILISGVNIHKGLIFHYL